MSPSHVQQHFGPQSLMQEKKSRRERFRKKAEEPDPIGGGDNSNNKKLRESRERFRKKAEEPDPIGGGDNSNNKKLRESRERFRKKAEEPDPIGGGDNSNNKKLRERRERSRKKAVELPIYCYDTDDSSPSHIYIKGERHTGTHVIEELLKNNLWNKSILESTSNDSGWKHGFLPPLGFAKEKTRQEEMHIMFVVVTRDVFMWLASMFKETYDPILNHLKENLTFSEFLRMYYITDCHPRPGETPNGRMFPSQAAFYDTLPDFESDTLVAKKVKGRIHNYKISESADNVIQIRTQKYKQWLTGDSNFDVGSYNAQDSDYPIFLPNRVHLELESLSYDSSRDDSNIDGIDLGSDDAIRKFQGELQRKVLHGSLIKKCVNLKQRFTPVLDYVKWNKTLRKIKYRDNRQMFDLSGTRKETLKTYTRDDIEFVFSQLDLEFEKKLGYEYGYVYEYLKELEL